jgi:hypothetical protein
MTEEPVPEDVRAFILAHIGSVAQLEALLLLRRHADEEWSAGATAARLYVTDAVAAEVLAQLCADGLLACHVDIYRYSPATPALLRMVDRLADAYARFLIPVTNIIHNNPLRLRRFADAFRFRKD